jgi:hypothetical protein
MNTHPASTFCLLKNPSFMDELGDISAAAFLPVVIEGNGGLILLENDDDKEVVVGPIFRCNFGMFR